MLHSLLKAMRDALVLCAGTLQYEASTLPAAQMQQTVLPENTQKSSNFDQDWMEVSSWMDR